MLFPLIAQLVEQRTVEVKAVILRPLVRIQLKGIFYRLNFGIEICLNHLIYILLLTGNAVVQSITVSTGLILFF